MATADGLDDFAGYAGGDAAEDGDDEHGKGVLAAAGLGGAYADLRDTTSKLVRLPAASSQ